MCWYYGNAWVCVKWQCNASDCVPVTPVKCVSQSFRTHPCVLAFITHIIYKRNWEGSCLVNFIYFSYIFFKLAICFIALVKLFETSHLKRPIMVIVWLMMLLLCCYNCDCTQQHYDVTQFEYVVWCHTMHEWVMNIHHQTWIAQGHHKHNPHPLETVGHVW